MTNPDLSWRPLHAYVPGQTARHAEDLFDRYKFEGAPSEIAESSAWQMGLHLLADGYFWECHEVLESVWLAAPPNSAERRLAQGIIQLANAALKQRMGQRRAAGRLVRISDTLVSEAFDSLEGELLNLTLVDIKRMRQAALSVAQSSELKLYAI